MATAELMAQLSRRRAALDGETLSPQLAPTPRAAKTDSFQLPRDTAGTPVLSARRTAKTDSFPMPFVTAHKSLPSSANVLGSCGQRVQRSLPEKKTESQDGRVSLAARRCELETRLRMAESERDSALQEVDRVEAETTAREESLVAEVAQLHSATKVMQSELNEASTKAITRRQEIESGACRELDYLNERRTNDRWGSLAAETQELARELERHKEAHRQLGVRMRSLLEELEVQKAQQKRLEEQLQVSHATEEKTKQLLAEMANAASEASALARQPVALRKVKKLADATIGKMPSLPPANAVFEMDSPERDPRASGQEALGKDLEFAYDWGLELSTRMPVARALQLAQWAASALGAEGRSPTSPPTSPLSRPGQPLSSAVRCLEDELSAADEDRFAQPLAELQEALAVLQRASRSRRGTHVPTELANEMEQDVDDSFSEPIADLQKALVYLQTPDPKPVSTIFKGLPPQSEALEAFYPKPPAHSQ